MKLGKLEEVDIREVWPHEQYDFSKWLSSESNLKELGDILHLSLTDAETEESIGGYRCDILCKDEITGKVVLIENQLEASNHDHLGKIITYASGVDAFVVVWIVQDAREEHASAIEWLNKHTDNEVSFFLIELHAYKIGNSDPAPYFKVIEQPNDFNKNIKKLSQNGELNETELKRLEFWTKFNDILDEKGNPFSKRKATAAHWYDIALGSSKYWLSVNLLNREHRVRIGFWIRDDKKLYDKIESKKEEIEGNSDLKFEWNRLDEKKSSVICIYIDGLDFEDQSNYTELMEEIIDKVMLLKTIFSKYI